MADSPGRAKIIAAFAAVYIIWGSTYLAILFAIDTLPPFLMAGTRFLVAGALLFGWSVAHGYRRPTGVEWRAAAIVGALLLLGGNGAVVWAEQHVASGVVALLVAVTPGWMVVLAWLWQGARRPGRLTVAGLVLGFGGMVLLIGPGALTGVGSIHIGGVAVVMVGSLAWATGSLYSRRAPLPPGALYATGMQMLAGGTLLFLAGTATGEFAGLDPTTFSLRSLLAWLYLTVFGAIIGYSAYVWLLRHVSPGRVATYAYVNPLVAVILGWALAGEAFTPRMALAAAVVVTGVAMITLGQHGEARADRDEAAELASRTAA
jgi:drug/metabolite transporter (DMT)-like permease